MKVIKTRNYNINTIFKIIVLLGFALFFFLTIQSGQVLKYVHPRNLPFIRFAAVAMVMISFFLIPEVFKPQRIKVNSMPLLFFVVPLIMAFLLPAQSFNSGSISYEELKLERNSGNTNESQDKIVYSDENGNEENVYVDENEYEENVYEDEYFDNENQDMIDSSTNELQLSDGIIIMEDGNYIRWLNEIYENIEKYNDKKIEVIGFVFKDEQFNDNEFVAARMVMVCCAAHMQTVGLLCKYENAAELEVDTWIKVYGTISNGEFEGSNMPVIKVDKVENVEKPEVDYVYPF